MIARCVIAAAAAAGLYKRRENKNVCTGIISRSMLFARLRWAGTAAMYFLRRFCF